MARELINSMTCSNLSQFNHTKNSYGKILDLIFSNGLSIDCKRSVPIVDEDAYHPALSFCFESKDIKFMKLKRQKAN